MHLQQFRVSRTMSGKLAQARDAMTREQLIAVASRLFLEPLIARRMLVHAAPDGRVFDAEYNMYVELREFTYDVMCAAHQRGGKLSTDWLTQRLRYTCPDTTGLVHHPSLDEYDYPHEDEMLAGDYDA